MKTFNEKEKKLQNALNKLNDIDIQKVKNFNIDDFKSLEEQKNQLEIEKTDLENKYLDLETAYKKLKLDIEEIESRMREENHKEKKFEEKIDKWQM